MTISPENMETARGAFDDVDIGAKSSKHSGNSKAPPPKPGQVKWLDMTNWDNEPTPQYEWAVRDRIPLRQTSLLSGTGGIGKSTVQLQLSVATVLGLHWLGSMPELGPAFFIVAIDRPNSDMITRPDGATRVEPSDGVVILGRANRAEALRGFQAQ